ncbi:ECF-type sigma factor [Luteolibacter flavescens]|uniref:ECF-type sigma factor n=1 Tax=Luteolibacter flavescens TaxID=1859460 RepID=A0ABT3FMU0_9BACT|nr:ECF-type sigma factor [Luteolibacter flavescens]MCW1884878.1 ECF-type sigma factor [Luteolibacter flavescens]
MSEQVQCATFASFQDGPFSTGGLTSHRMLPLVYDKLRRLAASKMFRERGLQTLQPTALVHEAWLRLVSSKSDWHSQAHFLGAAAEAMRRVLVDRSRSKSALKRQTVEPEPDSSTVSHPHVDHLVIIHESLKILEKEDPMAAEIVVLKFFSGFTSEEIASMSFQSVRAVERQWTFAKARLFKIIRDDLQSC